MMKPRTFLTVLAVLAALLALPALAAACDDCETPLFDAAEAHARSLREGRDAVEGFWLAYLDWMPEDAGIARSYRMAIVKNTYGAYPGADYVGVATCDSPGCRRGEVKLTLKRRPAKGEFDAELFVTEGVTAKGRAILTDDRERDRRDSVLDTRGVKYGGQTPTVEIVRIIGG